MKATQALHDLGQSLWLDNITRKLLSTGMLERYIAELSVTGLTSNPTIFEHAIGNSGDYDADIREKLKQGRAAEELFLDLALADVGAAADLFRPVHERTQGVDGWASLEVSPLLAHDTESHGRGGEGPSCPRRTPQRLHQDPRHEGRPPGHRGSDLRRRTRQRDAAVLPRAIFGGGRCVFARH